MPPHPLPEVVGWRIWSPRTGDGSTCPEPPPSAGLCVPDHHSPVPAPPGRHDRVHPAERADLVTSRRRRGWPPASVCRPAHPGAGVAADAGRIGCQGHHRRCGCGVPGRSFSPPRRGVYADGQVRQLRDLVGAGEVPAEQHWAEGHGTAAVTDPEPCWRLESAEQHVLPGTPQVVTPDQLSPPCPHQSPILSELAWVGPRARPVNRLTAQRQGRSRRLPARRCRRAGRCDDARRAGGRCPGPSASTRNQPSSARPRISNRCACAH